MNKAYSSTDILLPDFNKTDPSSWAVIACDQFTSQPDYWKKAEEIVGDKPSTLNMILPEVYLSETETRLPIINATMKDYEKNILVCHKNSMIYVERKQSDESVRQGLMLAVDLETYDYKKGATSLIRATEATVVERIPPRVAIRRGAVLELPHVMLLIDDPDKTVIDPLANEKFENIAYDTELMLGGGNIKGYFLSEEHQEKVSVALDALTSAESMEKRYGDNTLSPILFAVGDGNHSLASAKATYEEIKAKLGDAAADHPARYALVEVVNIHSDALKFEPIYRVVFNVQPQKLLDELFDYANKLDGDAAEQTIEYVSAKLCGKLTVKSPKRQLTVGTLQDFLDIYIGAHPEAEIDYIHGESALCELAGSENALGFIFDGMAKDQLFKTVIYDGALPRKTFSMGHAEDKRYYMECRKISR